MERTNRIVILLTACVNPGGMSFTVLQNSDERLKQYQDALDWYLNNTNYPIVFVENTKSDFSYQFKQYVNAERLEYITFDGNKYPRDLGKGYGEALIIKEAFKQSFFLKKCDYVVKVTGRLVVRNINQLISEAINGTTKMVASQTSLKNKERLCSSYFCIANTFFYKDYFLPNSSSINDSKNVYFENILFNCIVKWLDDGYYYHEFYQSIDILGVSGSTGIPYPVRSLVRDIKAFIKGIYINVIKKGRYIYNMP